MTVKKLSIGSWSEGSTKAVDQANAVLEMARASGIEFDDYVKPESVVGNDERDIMVDLVEAVDHLNQIEEGTHDCDGCAAEWIYEVVDEAIDVLYSWGCVPIYCRIGTHEGDGADFGVWPDHDAIAQAIKDGFTLQGDEQVRVNPEDGVIISTDDHGGIEVYEIKWGDSLLSVGG